MDVGWASVLAAHSSPFGNYGMPKAGRKEARMVTEGSNQINLERPNVPQLVLSSVAVLYSLPPNAHFSLLGGCMQALIMKMGDEKN